ncbi:hypothetical protein ACIBG8_08655 [Nonomuraea sp. NPDC050556]|uniref:hypothetical protein n=1 Tax=Nonomuraea sp. NPDC050556 TaxID=3364369 RepID=UPI0037A1811B
MKIIATVALAAAALAGQLVTTAAASAAVPGRTAVFANSAGDSTASKTARAFCPSGTVVVGGGAALQALGSDSVKFRTVTPFRSVVDGRYGYTVIAEELRPFASNWSVAARAICAPAPAGYEIRSVTVAGSSVTPKTAAATCSPGRKALAPGGTVRGSNQVTLRGAVVNNARDGAFAIGDEVVAGFSGTWDMIATVVCANQPTGYAVVENQVASNGQPDSAVQVTCPPGTTVHGTGGLIIPSTAGDTHLYSFTSVEPNLVLIRAHRSTPTQNGTWQLRAQATCAA